MAVVGCDKHADVGRVVGCSECGVANAAIPTGRCRCETPMVEQLRLWGTAQCQRCGRELEP